MTLTELVIAMAISVVVVMGTMAFYVIATRLTLHALQFNRIHNEASLLADTLARDIRHAGGIDTSFQSFQSSNHTLILKLPAIDSNMNIIDINNDFDRVVYHPSDVNSSILVREVIPDPSSSRLAESKIFGDILSGVAYMGTFLVKPDPLGAYVIHYRFKAQRTFQDETFEMPLSGSLRLRNKV